MPKKSITTAAEEPEMNPSAQESQTDTELTEMQDESPGIQAEGTENSPDSQTEPEGVGNEALGPGLQEFDDENTPGSQTGTEPVEFLADAIGLQAGNGENEPNSQTGVETEPNLADTKGTVGSDNANPDSVGNENGSSPQTDSENAASGSGSPDAEPKKPRRRAKKSQSGDTDELPSPPDVGQESPPKPTRRRKRAAPVLAIDEQRTVETDEDKLKNDLLDLVESLKGKKILAGTIQGVERSADNPNLSFAVIYHGAFKVIIPAEEAVEPPKDFRDRSPADVMHYLLTKRLGAEVDFIIKGVDPKSGIAAASRLEAMALKRRQYYFGSDRDGNNLIYEGLSAEARVISVIRAGIFIDLFGLEAYIPLVELSYQRWIDAAAHFQPGQRVLVKILQLDRSSRDNIRVSASVKQAGENPYEKALKRYTPGCRYVGTVSVVDTNGVFVSLEGGIDCLCSYPKRGRPPRGSRVTIKIIGVNHENNRIWGAITHMTTTR